MKNILEYTSPAQQESILIESQSPAKAKHNCQTTAHSNMLLTTHFQQKLLQAHQNIGLTQFRDSIDIKPFDQQESILLLTPESNRDSDLTVKSRDKLLERLLFDDGASQRDSLCLSVMSETMLLERVEVCSCGVAIYSGLENMNMPLKKRVSRMVTEEIFGYFFKQRKVYCLEDMKDKWRRFLISKEITFKHYEIDEIIHELFSGSTNKCCHHRFFQYISTFTQYDLNNILFQAWQKLEVQTISLDDFVQKIISTSSKNSLDSLDCGQILTYQDFLVFYHLKQCRLIARIINRFF